MRKEEKTRAELRNEFYRELHNNMKRFNMKSTGCPEVDLKIENVCSEGFNKGDLVSSNQNNRKGRIVRLDGRLAEIKCDDGTQFKSLTYFLTKL